MYTLQTVFFSNYSYRVSLCLEYVRHVYVLTQLITLYTITMLWDLRNIPKTHESRSSEWKWEHLHKHIRFELCIHIWKWQSDVMQPIKRDDDLCFLEIYIKINLWIHVSKIRKLIFAYRNNDVNRNSL